MISAKLMLPLLLLAVVSTVPFTASAKECPALLNHSQTKLNSVETVSLCEAFQGNVLLIVNTASQCGFTPQLSGLETLYNTYKDRGFTVIGFPSNDFRQDRGSEANTAKVCYLDYGVTFPMMSRSSIKGEGSNPVFKALKHQPVSPHAGISSSMSSTVTVYRWRCSPAARLQLTAKSPT